MGRTTARERMRRGRGSNGIQVGSRSPLAKCRTSHLSEEQSCRGEGVSRRLHACRRFLLNAIEGRRRVISWLSGAQLQSPVLPLTGYLEEMRCLHHSQLQGGLGRLKRVFPKCSLG